MSKNEKLKVPDERLCRTELREIVRNYVKVNKLVPPLSMEELQEHTDTISGSQPEHAAYSGFITVLLGNEVWSDTLASIPYERRVLLLPQCLRDSKACSAEIDEFGLLCAECGKCPIAELQEEAEDLGYVVLIAEGTTVVTRLLEGGKIDAVIGVSCLSALERSFPHMASHAIPGLAIPLFRNGCVDTGVDVEWIREAIQLQAPGKWSTQRDLDNMRQEIDQWFTRESLSDILQHGTSATEKIRLDWLALGGKRWRPFLSTCVFKALTEFETDIPDDMKYIAVAVECFHKASLIHDDIEDNDPIRYDAPTLHMQHGMPVALNAGDLLIGDGYRLITNCRTSAEQIARLLETAAEGHRMLCLGQGEELLWINNPVPITQAAVLDIFRQKTAPAFEVALLLGAIYAGADENVCNVLSSFSRSLGIAYQINDDIADFNADHQSGPDRSAGLSLLFAIACDHFSQNDKVKIVELWTDRQSDPDRASSLHDLITGTGAAEKAQQLFEHYRKEAIRSLTPLQNAHLKSLLCRISTRILNSR